MTDSHGPNRPNSPLAIRRLHEPGTHLKRIIRAIGLFGICGLANLCARSGAFSEAELRIIGTLLKWLGTLSLADAEACITALDTDSKNIKIALGKLLAAQERAERLSLEIFVSDGRN